MIEPLTLGRLGAPSMLVMVSHSFGCGFRFSISRAVYVSTFDFQLLHPIPKQILF
jgi:hypothetical protein